VAAAAPPAVLAIAPAKINLALEILGRRDDGYHELETVITTIALADHVTVRPAAALQVTFAGPGAVAIASDVDLAGSAARALAAAAGRAPEVAIEIEKRIPVAAGLGGGAADAAATLRALDRLWTLGWPVARLAAVGAQVGSDVPALLHGGVTHCRGRGELVEPLRDLRPLRLLVIVPPVPVQAGKTARRFAAVEPRDWSGGDRARRLAHRVARGAPPPAADLVNAFEAVVERTAPELVAHYARYAQLAGGGRLHLCGAGPAAYLFVREDARVAELRRELEATGAQVFATATLGRTAATVLEPN
jgi:4-diphosphocytidyl-2-C-methyl-D-erythritol kinase